MNPITAQIDAIACLCAIRNIPMLDLLAIRLALTDALETLDHRLGKPAAAPGLRGDVYTCESIRRDAHGEIIWRGFIVIHDSEHGGSSGVLGHFKNPVDAEAAAAIEAKRMGARYEPASCERPLGGAA